MPTQFPTRGALGVLVIAAVSSVAMSFGGSAAAQVSQPVRSPNVVQAAGDRLADLEEAFWVCDYLATTKGLSDGLIGVCTAVYDELKQRRFGGDSDHLARWWQQNKSRQHARLNAIDRPRQ